MGLWNTIKQMWTLSKEIPVFLEHKAEELADRAKGGGPNPYLDQDISDMVYDTLEASLHAVWPLLKASQESGLMSARGMCWGVLYTFTSDETPEDQRGIAWELARLSQDYLPEDQDPAEMDGVRGRDILGPSSEPLEDGATVHRVSGEMLAFFDAALAGNYAGATNVLEAISMRLGQVAVAGGHQTEVDKAYKLVGIHFMGSCLASLADKYSEQVLDDDGED